MTGEQRAFTLDQYAATSCPVKTQNTFVALHETPFDPRVVEHFQESPHRSNVIRLLLSRHQDSICDLSKIEDPDEHTVASIAAMTQGTPIILNARLPADLENHRSGIVDILLLNESSLNPTYYPVIIKDHPVLTLTSRKGCTQLIATLSRPFLKQARSSKFSFRVDSRSADLLQLAHLWLMLSSCGFADEVPWGGVIGTDQDDTIRSAAITWVQLSEKQIRAFSYTSHHQWRRYSPLSRYQHEHRFRVRVANRALDHDGDEHQLVTSPVHIPECDACEWWPACQCHLQDDISLRIERSPLDAREIMTLRNLGISTITDLASTDVEALLPEYLPRVAHRDGAETRLRLAARRGRLLEAGVMLERLTTGPITLPTADVEIDLDIETSANNHAYLWGFLIDDRRSGASKPWYHSIHHFSPLTQAKELELGEEVAKWLMEYVDSLGKASVLVWHYSHYEVSTLQRLTQFRKHHSGALTWLTQFAEDHFIDLLPLVTDNFFGVDGLGLKTVAAEGAGFSWRDPEPSGLNSQHWFADAVNATTPELHEAATSRILRYNEDDVRATWALRRWIRSLT